MFTRIDIEGVDKTGKDTLCNYLCKLSNYKYIINNRGILSQLVYNDVYKRNVDYSNVIKDNKHTLIVYLTADIEDLGIRFKINNEPEINIEQHIDAFEKYIKVLKQNGISILKYNTSKLTPYMIAKDILRACEVGELFK